MGELYFLKQRFAEGGAEVRRGLLRGFFGVRLRAGFEQIVASMVRVGAGLVASR